MNLGGFYFSLVFPKFLTLYVCVRVFGSSVIIHLFLEAMVTEDHEMPNGWPLGLGIMNVRLGVVESSQAAAAEPYSLHMPSASFSTFSSSNLDTESTASFFHDHSVSLGRLIGIRPEDRGALYFPNTIDFEEHERIAGRGPRSDVSRDRGAEMARGICIPLLLTVIDKVSRSKSSKQ